MLSDSSPEIVAELKSGDANALREIHRLYYPALRNFAGNLLHDMPAAEDILTEVFVTLWKKHADFDSLSNIKAFLFISARNACLNYVKKVQRDSQWKDDLSMSLSEGHEEFALNEMIRAEMLQRIYQEIEALPGQCKVIFKLSYIEGLTNTEIAEQFNLSVNTVKNHKVKALNLLRLRFPGKASLRIPI